MQHATVLALLARDPCGDEVMGAEAQNHSNPIEQQANASTANAAAHSISVDNELNSTSHMGDAETKDPSMPLECTHGCPEEAPAKGRRNCDQESPAILIDGTESQLGDMPAKGVIDPTKPQPQSMLSPLTSATPASAPTHVQQIPDSDDVSFVSQVLFTRPEV